MLKLFRKIHDKNNGSEDVHEDEGISPEVIAAISAAMEIILSEEDTRKHVLTIRRAPKVYSPWSSKIHLLRQVPNQFYKR